MNKKGNGELNIDTRSDFWWKPRIIIERFFGQVSFWDGKLEASHLVSMRAAQDSLQLCNCRHD